MPYRWLLLADTESRLQLWPHRSMTRRGFVTFIGVTTPLIFLPALTLIGSPAAWAALVFAAMALAGLWTALRKSERDNEILEELTIRADRVDLVRTGPRGRRQDWQANPHWVRVSVYASAGPVPHYVTLSGNGREVEIGAFLSEEERVALATELRVRLGALR